MLANTLNSGWKEEVTNVSVLNCCDSCSNLHYSVELLDISYWGFVIAYSE